MIGLLVASSALHAEKRRPTRGERLALEGRCEVAVPELEGSYAYRAFRHPTVFPDREDHLAAASATNPRQYFSSNEAHRDERSALDARLSIPLVEQCSVSLLYCYRINQSTADSFDYDEHAVGLLFNVHLARAF